MEELVAKTELEREAARLERELQDLEALLAKKRERLSALSPMPVYWRRVRCGKEACTKCPHGPYPYLKVKKEGEDGVARELAQAEVG
jgi:histone acetyltransferase (RNA polymerase elongator complex component)